MSLCRRGLYTAVFLMWALIWVIPANADVIIETGNEYTGQGEEVLFDGNNEVPANVTLISDGTMVQGITNQTHFMLILKAAPACMRLAAKRGSLPAIPRHTFRTY